jgi:hypothetical protein
VRKQGKRAKFARKICVQICGKQVWTLAAILPKISFSVKLAKFLVTISYYYYFIISSVKWKRFFFISFLL